MAETWSRLETDLIVKDYFEMLIEEIAGKAYNKAEHRRNLQPLLVNRSEGSIEFKHRNISAVLANIGAPYIIGYIPAWNYQKLLAESVVDYLQLNHYIEKSFAKFADNSPGTSITQLLGFNDILEQPPESRPSLLEPEVTYSRKAVKINYLEVEQANKQIGFSGEKIALEYEKWRLIDAGKSSLADRIEWVSQSQGDGLGFDILSKNTNGTDRYIEVKSTKLTKEAPIFFSKNEFDFSMSNSQNYFLYRVFNLNQKPKLFIVNGKFDDFCHLQPVKYKGYF